MLELFIRCRIWNCSSGAAGQNGRFGVLLVSAALAASGPAATMGGGHIGGLGGGHFGGFWRPVHGLERRGATATVARELESEIHGLLFFETLG